MLVLYFIKLFFVVLFIVYEGCTSSIGPIEINNDNASSIILPSTCSSPSISANIIDWSYSIDAQCTPENFEFDFRFWDNSNPSSFNKVVSCQVSNLDVEWAISGIEEWTTINGTEVDLRYSQAYYANSSCFDDFVVNFLNNDGNYKLYYNLTFNLLENHCNVVGGVSASLSIECNDNTVEPTLAPQDVISTSSPASTTTTTATSKHHLSKYAQNHGNEKNRLVEHFKKFINDIHQ